MSKGWDLADREDELLSRRRQVQAILRAARRRHPDALLDSQRLADALELGSYRTYETRLRFERTRDPFTSAEAAVIANLHRLVGDERDALVLALSGAAEPGGSGAIRGETKAEAEREIANLRATPSDAHAVEPATSSSHPSDAIAPSGVIAPFMRRVSSTLSILRYRPLLPLTIAFLCLLLVAVVGAHISSGGNPVVGYARAGDLLEASEGRLAQPAGPPLEFVKEVYLRGAEISPSAASTYVNPLPGEGLVFRILVNNPRPDSSIQDARLYDRMTQRPGLVSDEATFVAREARRSARTYVNLPEGYRLAYVPDSTRAYRSGDATGRSIPDVNGASPLVTGIHLGDVTGHNALAPETNTSQWFTYGAKVVAASVLTSEPAARLDGTLGVADLTGNTTFSATQHCVAGDVVIFKLTLNQQVPGATARDVDVSATLTMDSGVATISTVVQAAEVQPQRLENRVFLPDHTTLSYVPGSTAIIDEYAHASLVTDRTGSAWPLESPWSVRAADLHEPLDDEQILTFRFVVAAIPTS